MDGLYHVFLLSLDSYAEILYRAVISTLFFGTMCGLFWLMQSTKGDTLHMHDHQMRDFIDSSEFHDLYQVYTQQDFAINVCLTNGTIEIKHRKSSAYVLLYPQWNKCTHEKLAKGIEDSIKFLL